MRALVYLLLRFRPIWLALLLLTTVLAAWRASHLEFDFSFRSFFIEGRERDEFANGLEHQLGHSGGSSLVAVLQGDDVFRPEVLVAIQEMSDAVETIPSVDHVYSLATVPFIHGEADGLAARPITALVEDGTDVKTIRAAMLASPLYAHRLISTDGRTTAVLGLLDAGHQGVATRAPTIAAFKAAIERHIPQGFAVVFTGYPLAEAEYARLVWKGFFAAEMAAIALMAAILYASYRTIAGVALPLVTVGVGTILTLGFMEAIGQQISFTNASVPLMVLVIGIGEVSFFIARYYEEAARGGTVNEIVFRTATSVIPPALIAAGTTSAGFISLMTGHIGLTRDLGIALSFAIVATFLAAAILVPTVFSFMGHPPGHAIRSVNRGPMAGLLGGVANVNRHHAWIVALATVVVFVLGGIGAAGVTVAQYATRELPKDNPVRSAQDLIDKTLSGTFETQVGLRQLGGGTITAPDALREIEAFEEFLGSQPHVVKTWSVVDYLKEVNVAMHSGRADYRRLPDDAATTDQYLLLLASGGRTSDLPKLLDPSHQKAAIVVGTDDLGTRELQALHTRAQEWISSRKSPRLEARFLGDYWLVSRGADSLVRDLFVSTLTSFLIVFGMVALFLRSWRLTLLSVPPNLLPLAAALAIMGFAGITLRVGTSIILPVALGIAVDSTVHYLARVSEEYDRDGDYTNAMTRALQGTGRGMVLSALVLVFGFSCFLIPEFLVFRHIGILGAATLLVAALADLFLTPSLVLWFRPLSGTCLMKAGHGRRQDCCSAGGLTVNSMYSGR